MKKPLLEPGEFPRVALGFACFFLLLCSYYILRPVRDEMGVQGGVERANKILMPALFISLVVMVSCFGTLHGSMMTGPRIFFAMADRGLFFRAIALPLAFA